MFNKPAIRNRTTAAAVVATGAVASLCAALFTGLPAATAATAAAAPPRMVWLDDQESPSHSYSQSQAVAQATRFSIISALANTYSSYVPAMKAANPNLKLAAYMNATMASPAEAAGLPESWFLHDGSGRRITNSWHLFLMDPNNAGWVSNRVSKCASLVAQSHYDGCFLDNLGDGTFAPGMVSAPPVDPNHPSQSLSNRTWLTGASNLAAVVRKQTGKLLFANGLVSGQVFYDSSAPSSVLQNGSDITCAETFVRTAKMGINQYRDITAWQADLRMIAQAASQGKRVTVITKVWVGGTQQQVNTWHAFAAGTFLLGANGQQAFEFSSGQGSNIAAGDSVLAALGNIGVPAGAYTQSNGVYQRQFSAGTVLVNPNSNAATISVPASRDALTGAAVQGSITLPGHSARFLAH